MTNLLIDPRLVVNACAEAGDDSRLTQAVTEARQRGDRLWLYAGALDFMVRGIAHRLPDGGAPDASFSEARGRLDPFTKDMQWLAALAEDCDTPENLDPLTGQLVVAVRRLGSDAKILTEDGSSAFPSAGLDDYLASETGERRIDFIDLKAQQDRVRASLESGIHRVLHHGQYIMGPEVGELERRLAEYVGVEHCIAISSGTDALMVALMSLGVGPGDEVITTPFTFIATGEVIALLGAVPVYVDIERDTYNIDPAQIEAAISPKTKAIVPVSLYGQCADMDAINAVADRHQIPVVEDAAQSIGATYKGRKSGALSLVACTSFFPAKPLGAYGDAGACFTDDASLARSMREVMNHGQDRRYHHPRLGLNGRLDSMQAAVLVSKLEILNDEIERRQAVAERYNALIGASDAAAEIRLPFVEAFNLSSWAQYTIWIERRDEVQDLLSARQTPTAVHYPVPLYRQPALATDAGPFPVSEESAQGVISLPMHPYLDAGTSERVASALEASILQLSDA